MNERQRLLRVVICGSEDVGTPTLIDRLNDSPGARQTDEDREQAVFCQRVTANQHTWLAADARGERSVCGLVTAAIDADLAIVVVDLPTGVTAEIRRHSYIVSLLGVRRVLLAIAGMDRVEWSQEMFRSNEREYLDFAARIGLSRVACIPISLTHGDNLLEPGARMSWYSGPTMSEHIGQVDTTPGAAAMTSPHAAADRFEASVIWMHERPMLQGRSYLFQLGSHTRDVTVAPLKYSVNVNTLEHVATKKLEMNEVGVCGLDLSEPVPFAPYSQSRERGRFTLIDRIEHVPVGIGLLHFALRRSENVHWQALDVNKVARAALKSQKPCVVWFTGLSGAGKSTICNLLDKRLHAAGRHTYVLDGDNVRHGLNRDLGFTEADRVENIRRVAEVAHLMADAGLIVLVSFISPFRAERRMARGLMEQGEFIEVFVDTPIHVAEARDPKGLYKKARRGDLKNFTGVDSPYEVPEASEIRIDTTRVTPEQAVDSIISRLRSAGTVPS
ncbi:MAG: adenylyl-sulfate kinase [Acidobacteria bacterium]|nr:adenylyl-sulfate kinase [Acidobacteriota bacterium]